MLPSGNSRAHHDLDDLSNTRSSHTILVLLTEAMLMKPAPIAFIPAILFYVTLASYAAIAAPPAAEPAAAESKDVTAAQVNGTWKSGRNTLKIWALGHGKLQIAFDGVYEYKLPSGPMANTGEGAAIANIEGDTAIFVPEGAGNDCKITLRFTAEKLIVKQEGECGFGNHVYADGTYRKVSAHKPKFDQ
jgi:hypothetical protein